MEKLRCWLQSSLRRVYPSSEGTSDRNLRMVAARNEQISFQACLRNISTDALSVRVSAAVPPDLPVSIRRVGYVPVAHLNTGTEPAHLEGTGHVPGLLPDPLFDEDTVTAGPLESHAFWLTISTGAEVDPGTREVEIIVSADDQTVSKMKVTVDVRPCTIQRTSFPVTHWFYADAICDWYRVEPFEEGFWRLQREYVKDCIGHGSNCLYVPIFTPPTDGVKRPTQLLKVSTSSPGRYEFDFSDVRRWVEVGKECGAQYFEWTHLFSQWGAADALRIYLSNHDQGSLLWPPETGATSETYRSFLAQFLPKFREFLESEGILDRSFFHVSDEPHGEEHLANYRAAREMLRDLAPWVRVMDALSELDYGKLGLTDTPIPTTASARQYSEAGIPSWVYYCCGPRGRYLNRLMDTPLAKVRMHGWLFRRLNAQGFLHWGYNYWYRKHTQQLIDPYAEQAGCAWPSWAYGDTFVVYPGESGPVDSIRWEVFGESMRDYALLETLGIEPDHPLLADIRGYDDFPFTEEWIVKARETLLASGRNVPGGK